MAAIDPAALATPAAGVSLTPGPAVDALVDAILDIAATLDANELEPAVLRAATNLLGADGASLWQVHGGSLICPIAIGPGASRLVGRRAGPEDIGALIEGVESLAVLAAPV